MEAVDQKDDQLSAQAIADEYDNKVDAKNTEYVGNDLVAKYESLDETIANHQLQSAIQQAEAILSQNEGWVKTAIEYVSSLAKAKAAALIEKDQQPGGGGDEPDSSVDMKLDQAVDVE